MSASHQAVYRAISFMIVAVLAAQTAAGFIGTGRFGWPIIPYYMYIFSHHEGDRITEDVTVYAVLDDHSTVTIDKGDFNDQYAVFWNRVIAPVVHNVPENLVDATEFYCKRHGGRVVAFKVLDPGIAIGRDGPVYGLDPQEIGKVAVSCKGTTP
jgi:hypothetical protein